MFDLRKLEAFCRVYEQRSFSRAGEVLFLSQPTISAHVQALEQETGVSLLDRLGRTILPTPAGTVLYRRARQAFAELDAARAEIGRLRNEVAGDLLLGGSTIPANHLLPGLVAAFAQEHSQVRLSLSVGPSRTIIRKVLDGSLMLGVVGAREEHPDLKFETLADDELAVIASPDFSALPDAVECGLGEAVSWPWIIRDEESGTRRHFEDALLKQGVNPRTLRVVLGVDSTQAAVQYVRAGLGVSVTSRLAVDAHLKRGELLELKISGFSVRRRFFAVMNARRDFFPAASAFWDYLIKQTAHLRNK